MSVDQSEKRERKALVKLWKPSPKLLSRALPRSAASAEALAAWRLVLRVVLRVPGRSPKKETAKREKTTKTRRSMSMRSRSAGTVSRTCTAIGRAWRGGGGGAGGGGTAPDRSRCLSPEQGCRARGAEQRCRAGAQSRGVHAALHRLDAMLDRPVDEQHEEAAQRPTEAERRGAACGGFDGDDVVREQHNN